MRILVTGREGQVAQSLAALDAADHEIMCVGRPELDLTDAPRVEQFAVDQAPDVIINAAAYTAVDKAESEPELAMSINSDGASAMARAAARLNIPIIQISTDYVFSGEKKDAYVETDTTGPLGVYGTSKLAGEQAVAALAPYYAIVRTSWVYSPFGNNFVKTMLRLGAERSEIRVVADQVGSPTSAQDLAEAILKIAFVLKKEPQLSGIYHVSGAGSTSWAGFADEIFSVQADSGKRIPIIRPITTKEYPTAATRPLNSRLNCQKLDDTFSLRLPPWQKSLRHCMAQL
jgi:dTDP-4-dehydrorhamnose reductase